MASNRVLISLTQEQDKRTGPAERSADLEEVGYGPYERMMMMISKRSRSHFCDVFSLSGGAEEKEFRRGIIIL